MMAVAIALASSARADDEAPQEPPLYVAIEDGCDPVLLGELVRQGEDPDAVVYGSTLLDLALWVDSRNKTDTCTRGLLSAAPGIDVDAANDEGLTPLMNAADL